MTKSASKLRLGDFQKFHQIYAARRKRRMEVRLRTWRGLAVPRADFLANVATENPIAHWLAQLFDDRTAQLNGQIADAPPCVERTGAGEGVGWAGVQASGAGAAMVGGVRRVWTQLQIEQKRP